MTEQDGCTTARAHALRLRAFEARTRLRTLPAALMVVVCVGAPGGGAQEPPSQARALPGVTTEMVRIDVMVTDKGGRPKAGLTRTDFVVLEDGVPQPIAHFEAFASQPPAPPVAASPRSGAEPAEAPPARAVPPGRYLVLAVDDVHIEASNLIQIKKTLDRFLEREVETEDQVALVTTSGVQAHEFTGDRRALQRSVARLSVQNRAPQWIGAPHMSEYQAEQIALGDPEALRVAVEEIQKERMSPYPEQEARTFARMTRAESVNNARITLETLDGLVRGLSGLRGRKVVVLVSDGFLTGLRLQAGAAFDIRRITDAGTRAGVVIYSLDSRGLVATSPGMSASSRAPVTGSTLGARHQMDMASANAIHDAMGALAADTGGFLIANSNDLGAGLRRIVKDTETFYLISYEAPNARRDGGFRKIEVRLPGLRDVRIRYRKGYFAPDDSKTGARAVPSGPPPTAAQPAALPDARPEAELRSALTSPAPLSGIPVRLSADFVSADGAAPQVVVSGLVDLKGVPFVQAADRHLATVHAAFAVFDESGAVVGRLDPERVALNLTNAAYERALENGLEYQRAVPMKPGRYRVRFAVRHGGEGGLGTASQWVEVPDLGEGKLTLSSLFLLKKEDPPRETGQIPTGDALALHSAQGRRRFRRGEALYLQVFVYNPGRDASGATDLVTQAEVWRGGVRLASTAPLAMAPSDRGAPPIPDTRRVNLDPFEPGEYEVGIVVTDRHARAMASRRVSFTIE